MSEINTYSVTIKVEEENLAVSMGSGSLCVLALRALWLLWKMPPQLLQTRSLQRRAYNCRHNDFN